MKTIKTLFCIVALLMCALVFGVGTDPPVANAAEQKATQTALPNISVSIAGVEKAIQYQNINAYPAGTYRANGIEVSRFDFKITNALRMPQNTMATLDRPPLLEVLTT